MKNNSVRLSVVEPVGGYGGNEFYDFGLCEAMTEKCDVGFYTCTDTTLHEKYDLKTPTYKFYKNIYGNDNAAIRGLRYLLGSLKSVFHSRKRNVNVAHFHIYHFAWREWADIALFKLSGVRVVATIHDVETFSKESSALRALFSYKKFTPFIDQYIVHSNFAYENLVKLAGSGISRRLQIVAHGDTDFIFRDQLDRKQCRKELNIPEGKSVILFFGQIKKVKGVDVLIDGFARLLKTNDYSHLLIVGRPWKYDGAAIEEKIAKLGIEKHVTLNMSYVDNSDVPKYFASANLAVLPYLKIYSSGVVLRTLDYGTPAVVSDLDPLVNIVEDKKNGRVFRAGDSSHLAEVLSEVIDDEVLLQGFAKEGKKVIAEKYSWDIVSSETMAVYQKALGYR